jgi:23S rRNA pseudouridine2605 synthase
MLLARVELDDGPVVADGFRVLTTTADKSIVELVLHEGRNRIVRRLLAHVGHPVQRLTRTAIGPVGLGRLPAGAVRELSREELGELLDVAGL